MSQDKDCTVAACCECNLTPTQHCPTLAIQGPLLCLRQSSITSASFNSSRSFAFALAWATHIFTASTILNIFSDGKPNKSHYLMLRSPGVLVPQPFHNMRRQAASQFRQCSLHHFHWYLLNPLKQWPSIPTIGSSSMIPPWYCRTL